MKMSDIPEPLHPFVRPVWLPELTDGEGPARGTRFGGRPWLLDGEAWPTCKNCLKPLTLFVQLDMGAIPEPLREQFGRGLVQLFYCTSREPFCEVDCEAWSPFGKAVLARRLVTTEGEVAAGEKGATIFPPKSVTGWLESFDVPSWEEGEEFGIEWDEELEDATDDLELPHSGEKLGGWPLWCQAAEYPECPDCGTRMELLLQVDSEQTLPHGFGDAGIGHLTVCPRHRDRMAFAWACG